MRRVTEPGVYDLSEAEYHADPAPEPSLSSSLAKILLNRTPRHAWWAHPRLNPRWQPDNRRAFDLGAAAHAMVLGDKQRFALVEADDWRTNAAKDAREEAYAAGRVPLLRDQYEQTVEMAAAAHAQLEQHEEASSAYTNGRPEQTLIHHGGDVWLRCRLDWLPYDGSVFYDYKSTSTSANPDTFHRTLFDLGYDVQCAFYRRAIRAVLGIEEPHFHFVVQENYPPYALSVIGLPPGYVDAADKDAQKAIDLWRWCMERDTWPGYPSRTAYVEPPPWVEARRMEREMQEEMAAGGGDRRDYYAQLMDWQSPFDAKETTDAL